VELVPFPAASLSYVLAFLATEERQKSTILRLKT